MRLQGDMEIMLTDVNTGEVETVHEHNMVTNAINEILNSNPFGVFYTTISNNDAISWYETLLPLCPNLIGGILLFPNTIEEDEANTYQFSDNMPVAYASNDVNSTANVARGSMNLTESMPIENGFKFVWEFTAGQGNGTIASCALTSADGGKNAFGSVIGDATAFKTLKSGRFPSSLSTANLELLTEITEIDFEHNTAISLTYKDNSIIITRFHIPVFTIGLNDKLNDSTIKVEATRTILTTTFHFLNNYYQYGQFYDGGDGYWYGFANTENSSGAATMYWTKIRKSDYFMTEGVWTLNNVQIVSVGNQITDTYTDRNIRSCFRNGYLYVMASNKQGIYKINANNQTDITLIPLGFTSKWKSLGDTTNCNLYMTLIGDIIMGYDFQILADDTIIQTAGEVRLTTGGTPLFRYKQFYFCWGSSYSNHYRCAYLLTPYLVTINNLSQAVVKTASKTMKITYTLTEIPENS